MAIVLFAAVLSASAGILVLGSAVAGWRYHRYLLAVRLGQIGSLFGIGTLVVLIDMALYAGR